MDRLATYKSGHERLHSTDEISQADIDATVALLRGSRNVTESESQTQNPTTASILNCLAAHENSLSASEIAQYLGISRATAQRYLTQMADRKLVILELKYGNAGRPINNYRLKS